MTRPRRKQSGRLYCAGHAIRGVMDDISHAPEKMLAMSSPLRFLPEKQAINSV